MYGAHADSDDDFDGILELELRAGTGPPRINAMSPDELSDGARWAGVTDADLVAGVSARDEAALAEVYRLHSPAIYGLAKRLLRNPDFAEDVTQEIFVRLWNRPHRFDATRGSLRSFLLADAHGRSVDLIRSETARRTREEKDAFTSSKTSDDVELLAIAADVSDKVRAAVANLSDAERKAVELAYFGGHTYKQVAVILGEPEGTVKSRIRIALKKLRDPLALAGMNEP
jgi:RNA polymerase sigma-70 factor (ECF subfamily)